jgi:hypothetical protein
VFTPEIDVQAQKKLLSGWHRAVGCTYGWAKEE